MVRLGALAVGLLAMALAGCGQTVGSGSSLNVSAFGPADAATPGAEAIAINLDSRASKAAREAEFRALEYGRSGTPVNWKAGKFSGDVVPGTLYQVNTSTCRDYVQTIYLGSAAQKSRQTACRQPNGAWQPVT